MSDSLRILTYNTQLRSWAMEVGADESIPPSETAEERAKLIAQNVLASSHDYDIVCFNEVFDEDARDVLIGELLHRFPYAVTKADVGGVEVAWPGKPILSINPVALLLAVTGISFIGSWLTLGKPKLEDSGIVLFSRWPFALEPITEAMSDLLDPRALSEFTPIGMPRVGFTPYRASTGGDAWAAKGMLYVRIERDNEHTYHVFASHTQADDHHLGEHEMERVGQMAEVAAFIESCVESPPFDQEVFFLGDLNINGGQINDAVTPATKEWHERFVAPGLLSDHLLDAWGRYQCIGAPGLRDRGTTAPTVYAPSEQRLDYLFRSTTSGLAVQHLFIDYDLASVPTGIDGVSYLSDHRPLGSDLNRPQSNCTPSDAVDADRNIDADGDFLDSDSRLPAGVKWYRFEKKGTYEFRVDFPFNARIDVYLDTDLSRPRQQYRNEFTKFGIRYVLASAPFLVKISSTDRKEEYKFSFSAHRHSGTSISEAIDLVPGNTYPEGFPAGQLLNDNQLPLPWDDADSKWFRLDTPQTRVIGLIQLGIEIVLKDHADSDAFVFVVRIKADGQIEEVGQDGPSNGPLSSTWQARTGERFFIAVQRRDRGGVPLSFDITARTNVNILLGGKGGTPRLVCQDETSGWGSDDIALSIEADRVILRDISNDEIGDFDQDDVRDLDQWISETVVYLDHVSVKVIEEDDIDSNDVGIGHIPAIDKLSDAPGITIDSFEPDGTVRVRLSIDVDDGTYEFRASLARWHEKV